MRTTSASDKLSMDFSDDSDREGLLAVRQHVTGHGQIGSALVQNEIDEEGLAGRDQTDEMDWRFSVIRMSSMLS